MEKKRFVFATVFAVLAAFSVVLAGCEVPDSTDLSSLGSETPPVKVAAPTASPASGATIGFGGTIALATTTAGAEIWYKTGVTLPLVSAPPRSEMTKYTGPITVSADTNIAAVAVKSGMTDSDLFPAAYTYNASQLAEPVATPSAAAPYHAAFTVTLSGPEGATVRYTTDSTDPTASSTAYSAAIDITQNTTIKAFAVKEGLTSSAVMTAEYTLSPETPTAVQDGSAVTLATVTDGAAISYTTDNSDPAASGTKTTYTAGTPITLSAGTTTVKAVATKANWANSAVFSKDFTYTVGSANPPPSGGDSDPLTSVVYYSATANATTAGDLSNTSGTQAAPVWNLNVTEEPAVYFEIEKSAAQTITVGGADAAKVTKITEGSLDGTTASDTVDLFSVNMEDLLFNGAFGGSTDGSTIPSGTETRTFTLTVSEPSHTSRVITMTLDLSLDADTDTTIYHRKGEPGNYHYVKVRDAELGEDDKTNYATATSPAFSALTVGPVTDLQNAFVWVDHHGVAGDATTGATGYANGTTEGYSEYRLFVKKNQQIGKINVKFLNSKPQVDDYSMTYDTDLRNYISIELYGAGSPGGRENRITHDDSFSTTLDTQVFNHNAATSEGGLIGLAPSSTYGVGDREQWEMIQKHKALVLEKNITLAGNGSSVPMGAPDFSNPNNKWTTLAISYLIDVRQNSMVIMRNHAKVTDFYGVFAPINLATDSDISGKFYMYGGAITGNTFTGGSQSLVRGGTANTNMFLLGGDTTTGNVFN